MQHGKKWMESFGIRSAGRQTRFFHKSLTAGILALGLAFSPAFMSFAATAQAQPSLLLMKEDPIASGATLRQYEWNAQRGTQSINVTVHEVAIDLTNPYVKLDVMTGQNGQLTKKETVRNMATETGAVAGVNGDFFDTHADGAPIGPEISNSKLEVSAPLHLPGFYSFALTKENKPVIDLFTFKGTVKAKDGATYPLNGVNKTYYWYESSDPTINGQHSMNDSIFVYTNTWASPIRAIDRNTDLTEVLVENGVIKQIAPQLDMVAPKDGYILRTEGLGAKFVRDHLKVGDPVNVDYHIIPQDSSKTYDTDHFKMMIGGQVLLVDNGAPSEFSRWDNDLNGYRSRTGVGYSKDGNWAYLVTADRASGSDGLSLPEFQQLMVQLGIWKGMNLDGGGSTTMVARPLGETSVDLVGQTENSSERRIINGLGVYTLAPKGELKGIKIEGDTHLLVGEQASFGLKGYDNYYNPSSVTNPTWSVSKPIGTFANGVFTPTQKGDATLTVTSGNAKQNVDIHVIGRDDLAGMWINSSSAVVSNGADLQLSVQIRTKSGEVRDVPANVFQWESYGFKGTLNGGTLHIDQVQPNSSAVLIARYDGFSTIRALPQSEKKVWDNFDAVNPAPISFLSYPSEVKGAASITGLPGSDGNSAYFRYDMTQGTGTKAAYLVLGGDAGMKLDGEPQTISMKVNGDNSLNWLRAQFTDADGNLQYVDLARPVNWSGWKTVSASLTGMKYPITLKRIYMANPEMGQDERQTVGSIAIDDIQLEYKVNAPAPALNKVQLTIDQPQINVNGTTQTIDQAPVIVDGNTLVPVRFAVEALGGTIDWNGDERKVTVRYGTKLVDMWLDQPDLIANGQRITAEVAPRLMNERTMVPLRVLSENLGWKVTWDEKTRTVGLE